MRARMSSPGMDSASSGRQEMTRGKTASRQAYAGCRKNGRAPTLSWIERDSSTMRLAQVRDIAKAWRIEPRQKRDAAQAMECS